MFCTSLIVVTQCMLVCGGAIGEYRSAWGEPRWDNALQAIIDNYGPIPALYKSKAGVLWMTDAEPASCAPVPQFKPEPYYQRGISLPTAQTTGVTR